MGKDVAKVPAGVGMPVMYVKLSQRQSDLSPVGKHLSRSPCSVIPASIIEIQAPFHCNRSVPASGIALQTASINFMDFSFLVGAPGSIWCICEVFCLFVFLLF